jgi:serine/threonine-protein kinase HipA
VTIHLHIHMTTPDGTVLPAGELVVAEPEANGLLAGQFRYFSSYLAHPMAFSLDPIHLPLTDVIFDANRPTAGVHAVFEDSLPDDWGRRLLIRQHHLAHGYRRVPQLLAAMEHGLGALSFLSPGKQPTTHSRSGTSLEHLMELAGSFERNEELEDKQYLPLFAAGSSPGGARPKVLACHRGAEWIAKFPSVRDIFDMVGLEAATMELARQAGIQTALTEMVPCGSGKILLVRRFDLTPPGGRNHMISMQTLIGAEGYYSLGYRDMAEILRRISAAPAEDLMQLYRQVVFHAMIGNTDDHLKNFCMLHGQKGWRLSPAFDLLPDVGGNLEHQLHINHSFLPPDKSALVNEARSFNISRRKTAEEIIFSIAETATGADAVFQKFEVPPSDRRQFTNDISRRLKKMCISHE